MASKSKIPRAIPSVESVTAADPNLREILRACKANLEALYGVNGSHDVQALMLGAAETAGIIGFSQGGNLFFKGIAAASATAQEAAGADVLETVRAVITAGAHGAAGDHDLGPVIPAGCRVVRAWYEVTEDFTSAGLATVAVWFDANGGGTRGAGETLLNATAIAGLTAGTVGDGVETGGAAAFSSRAAGDCPLKVEIAVDNLLTGRMVVIFQYARMD